MRAEVGMSCFVNNDKVIREATVIKIVMVRDTQILDVRIDCSGDRNYFKLNKAGVWVDTECNHTGRWNLKNNLVLTF